MFEIVHGSSATLTCINSADVMSLVLLVLMPQRSDAHGTALESTSEGKKWIKNHVRAGLFEIY